MKITFAPSEYQQAVFDFVQHGTGSAIVVAGPGSGKSTTILQCLPLIPETKSVHMFAFNSTIGKELSTRIFDGYDKDGVRVPSMREQHGRAFAQVRAGTFHSVGFGAVCRHLGVKPFQVKTDANKLRNICKGWLGDNDREMYGDFICKLVGLAKGQGVGCLVPDTDDVWYEMVRYHDLYLDSEDASEEQAVSLARQLLRISNERAKHAELDFDDQLYLVVLWKLRLWQNDWVFVDEAQDTNPVRRAVAKLALKPGGRLVAVGDPRQAIYEFTGASADAMDLIKREFNCKELPLTVCYRCSAAVVEAVAEVYPGCIQAAPGARAGIRTDYVELPDALKLLRPTDAVLCRNTAPLVALAYDLIARGTGCRILGRDIADGLIKLIDKMRARDLNSLEEKLAKYLDRETAKFMARGEEGKAGAVSDRVSCIRTVMEHLDEKSRTVNALKEKIGGMFSDHAGNVLTLATMHKSKGKEWPRVGIYMRELMPSKFARQEHQLVQERNLDWVARSRAMEHLMWIPEAQPKEPKPRKPAPKAKLRAELAEAAEIKAEREAAYTAWTTTPAAST